MILLLENARFLARSAVILGMVIGGGSGCIEPVRVQISRDVAMGLDIGLPPPPDVTVRETSEDTVDIAEDTAPPCDTDCNGGTCVDGICRCAPGWDGPTCEEAICGAPCPGSMRCVSPDVCACPAGEPCAVLTCDNAVCPALPPLVPRCNARGYCDYTDPTLATKWADDVVWTLIPAGTFQMGSPDNEPYGTYARPMHPVTIVRGFLIAKLELTTRIYEDCVARGTCEALGSPDSGSYADVNDSAEQRGLNPQNALTREDAAAACKFLGARLPSAAEWEFAAKGPGPHRQYPWGNTPPPTCNVHAVVQTEQCPEGRTQDVGVGVRPAGASHFGVLDMAGNVAEWVSDCFHTDYEGAPSDGSPWIEECWTSNGHRFGVARGGSVTIWPLRTASVTNVDLDLRLLATGARCVRALP